MSYSITEGIRDAEELADQLRQIMQFDPKAYAYSGRWYSERVTPQDCDDVEIEAVDERVVVRACTRVGNVRVFPCVPHVGVTVAGSLVEDRLRSNPEAMRVFLDAVMRRGER